MNIRLQKLPEYIAVLVTVVMPMAVCAEETASKAPYGVIDLAAAISELPASSEKIIDDIRLQDDDNKGIRVFRLYKPVPPHYHEKSDTLLYLLTGEASVAINREPPRRVKPGTVLHWERGTIHEVTELHDGTATFLAIDVPARDPADAVFVEGKDVEFLE